MTTREQGHLILWPFIPQHNPQYCVSNSSNLLHRIQGGTLVFLYTPEHSNQTEFTPIPHNFAPSLLSLFVTLQWLSTHKQKYKKKQSCSNEIRKHENHHLTFLVAVTQIVHILILCSCAAWRSQQHQYHLHHTWQSFLRFRYLHAPCFRATQSLQRNQDHRWSLR